MQWKDSMRVLCLRSTRLGFRSWGFTSGGDLLRHTYRWMGPRKIDIRPREARDLAVTHSAGEGQQ